ncbi:MAG: phenylalanine--tRNA ligase subunit alpha, partial [Actinobacteria bacterium]|nr:phenylalanine--tRNA ligase subunit alpha [Actinomycetota bacterium]
MSLTVDSIETDKKAALAALLGAANLEDLKVVRLAHVGDKSPLAKANQALGSLPGNERAEFGKVIGAARAEVNAAYAEREEFLIGERDGKILESERVDVSLPTKRRSVGGLHPLTILTNEISDLFVG